MADTFDNLFWGYPLSGSHFPSVSTSDQAAAQERFRKLLVELRHSKNLTQAELARRLGKPQSFISKVELGERRLDVLEFIHFVQALGEDPSEQFRRLVSGPILSRRQR